MTDTFITINPWNYLKGEYYWPLPQRRKVIFGKIQFLSKSHSMNHDTNRVTWIQSLDQPRSGNLRNKSGSILSDTEIQSNSVLQHWTSRGLGQTQNEDLSNLKFQYWGRKQSYPHMWITALCNRHHAKSKCLFAFYFDQIFWSNIWSSFWSKCLIKLFILIKYFFSLTGQMFFLSHPKYQCQGSSSFILPHCTVIRQIMLVIISAQDLPVSMHQKMSTFHFSS